MRIDKTTAELLAILLRHADARSIANEYYLKQSDQAALSKYIEQLIDALAEYSHDKRQRWGFSLTELITKASERLNRSESDNRGGRRPYGNDRPDHESEPESPYLTDGIDGTIGSLTKYPLP